MNEFVASEGLSEVQSAKLLVQGGTIGKSISTWRGLFRRGYYTLTGNSIAQVADPDAVRFCGCTMTGKKSKLLAFGKYR